MNLRIVKLVTAALIISSAGCAAGRVPVPVGEVPTSGYVSAEDEQYGHEVLAKISEQYPLSKNDAYFTRVRNIVERLSRAASSEKEPWHVYVLQGDDVVNAAATRGNYIMVWSGLIQKVRSDDELASVLSHEVAHLLAGHTRATPAEEAAQVMSELGGTITGQIAMQQGAVGIVANIAEMLTKQVLKATIVNPEQQRKELEADQVGIFLMARAGYDPEKAVEFWERLEESGETDTAFPILSSHPTSNTRLTRLREILPRARDEYLGRKNADTKSPAEWSY